MMSPAKPISNIQAMAAIAVLIFAIACNRTDTRSSAVTTTSPAGSTTAPPSASAESRDEALVRIVHAIPDGAAMDVYAGDLLVFDGVGFKSVTSYRALDAKRFAFMVRPAGMTNAKPLSTNTEGLEDGRYYTVFVLPAENDPVRLRIVNDRLDTPSRDKARVRVAHGGNGLGSVDVRAAGATIFRNVTFQDVTGYEDVPPLDGALDVIGGGSTAITLPKTQLEAGRFYTIVIAGPETFIIEDKLAPPATAR